MASDYQDVEERPQRTWLWLLLLLLVAFLGGAGLAAYVVMHDGRAAAMLHLVPAAQAEAEKQIAEQTSARARAAPAPPAAPAAIDPMLGSRIDTLEGKVADIETQAREATGDASRAEGLLVAFAARRALDRGVGLGYIEGLLRQRFGGTQPQAVATILSASRLPVTLADLENGLDAVAPTLSIGGDPKESWWKSFRQELANMVVVRKTGEPSSQPADRVARAQRMLEAGQVDGALAEIVRLPDHAAANTWIPAARRYLAGRGALDQIETAALLDPTSVTRPPVMAPEPLQPAPVSKTGTAPAPN